ncbi:MAG: DMT family transporter [Ruminococcus sp.]|nr:DMT family transporter [Ruminococcus sp.]
MKSNRLLGIICLLVAAFLWGSTFVAQAETGVGPFTYLAMRSVVAVIFLLPIIIIKDLHSVKKNGRQPVDKGVYKTLLTGGAVCGSALFVASALQQIGIDKGTTAGKAGFITALYILGVPVLGLFLKKKVRPLLWVCVGVAVAGLFLLCMTGNLQEFSLRALFSADTLSQLSLKTCDIYVIACALGYSLQIMTIDKYSPKVDCLKLSFLQFSVTAVLSLIVMFIVEKPAISDILSSWISILYAGILSSGVAYTLQIVGQKYTPPTIASMLMSLESAFAVLSAIVFSRVVSGVPELPTGYEWTGIILMFTAIMLSQLPEKKSKTN